MQRDPHRGRSRKTAPYPARTGQPDPHPRGLVRRGLLSVLTLLLLIGGAATAQAEVYRWKDSKGKVHFGDQTDLREQEAVKEEVIPRPNVVRAFKASPTAALPEPATPSTGGMTVIPNRQLGIVAQQQSSCQAKLAAFQASRACFDACSRPIGRGRGRNITGCEHCVDQPMPHC